MSVIEEHTWADALLDHSSGADRMAIAKRAIENLKFYKSEDGRPTKRGLELFRRFSDRSRYELFGIATNTRYLKVKGGTENMRAIHVHPWGTPTLIFKEKDSPILLYVNVDLRVDKSIIHEIPFNQYTGRQEGASG